jgi:hypothetical protein
MFSAKFEKICTPAKLYFVLAVLSIIIGMVNGIHVMAILGKLLFAVVFTYFLSWLCKIGLKPLSWFLVLLPFIVILLVMFGLYDMTKMNKKMMM